MFNKSTVENLKALATAGSKFGIGRTRRLLNALSSPDKNLKIIHIAGTNGKGSTAAYISHSLKAAGKKAGTFTSPQVYSYEEQFCIDCEPISLGVLENYLKTVCSFAEKFGDKPTAFEIETVAALLAFYREGCEYAVIECGLGGLSDATNAIEKKQLAVITSVSLEHTAVLGDTVTEICRQKSGIIKDCPAAVSALQTEEGRLFFNNLHVKFADGVEILHSDLTGQTFVYGGETYRINMLGKAQCYNAATAVEACKTLGLNYEHIANGLAEMRLNGRNEIIEKGGVTYILDGSHNPVSFLPLMDSLKHITAPIALIYGCLSDKDVKNAAKILATCFEFAVLVAPNSFRAMDLDKIKGAFEGKIKDLRTAQTVSGALETAQDYGYVVVCGSFTLLKEAKDWIEKRQ